MSAARKKTPLIEPGGSRRPSNKRAKGRQSGSTSSSLRVALNDKSKLAKASTNVSGRLVKKSPWRPPLPIDRTGAPKPLPVEALPDWASDYVSALAESTQTPTDLAGMLILAVMATAAAKKVIVQVRPGWTEPTNLYIAVAMPPGSRKSPVFARVTAPLMAWERQAIDWARPNVKDALSRKRIAEDVVREAEKIAAGADGDEKDHLTAEAIAASESADAIEVPAYPRLLADDATAEAVASLLAEQNSRIAILSAEGDLFDIISGRYSRTPNLGVFLKGWSGDDLRVDRKGRPAEHVEAPALTLGLAFQPEVLTVIATKPGLRGRGLLARFLYSLPANNVGRRRTNTQPVHEMVEAQYEAKMRELITRLFDLDEPVTLTFAPPAARCFEQFEADIEPRLDPETGDLGHISDWGSKLVGHMARIAGLLHLGAAASADNEQEIQLETTEAAIEIAEYLIDHALEAFNLMGADTRTADVRIVLDWLESTGVETFTRRECHRALEARFPRVTDLKPVLALLTQKRWIKLMPTAKIGRTGRPPSPCYRVNPLGRSERQNRQKPLTG